MAIQLAKIWSIFMIQQLSEDLRIVKNSLLYKEFISERE